MKNRTRTRHPIADGILGGLGAGSLFICSEMIISAALGRSALAPLRLIASIVLGTQALGTSYSFTTPLVAGLILHMILSAIFGLLFLFLVLTMTGSRARAPLVVYGFAYGVILWIVNFYLIAPGAFPQFAQVNPFWNGFFAHSLFYGVPLGWFLGVGGVVTPLAKREESQIKQKRYGT